MPGGRPSVLEQLSDMAKAQLLAEIRGGVSPKCAAALINVHPDTMTNWLAWGAEGREPYASFSLEVQIAVKAYEADLLRKIASTTDWRGAAWALERLNREEYRPPTTTTEAKVQVSSVEELSEEDLERIASGGSAGAASTEAGA